MYLPCTLVISMKSCISQCFVREEMEFTITHNGNNDDDEDKVRGR